MTNHLKETFRSTVTRLLTEGHFGSVAIPKAYKRYVKVHLDSELYKRSLDLKGYDGKTQDGKKVYFTKTKVLGGFGGVESLSHAIQFRNTVFVGYTHADAIEKMLNVFADTPEKKAELTDIIDNDKERMDIGYFYDNGFHMKAKNSDMEY